MGRISNGLGRLKHAWNAFARIEYDQVNQFDYGSASFSSRQDRARMGFSNEKSIIASIYTRLAIDAAAATFRHVRLDDDDRFLEELPTGLNNCLKFQANVDQEPAQFFRDIMFTLFDKGSAVIAPVDATLNPNMTGGFDVVTMRVGEIDTWFPKHVRASVYDERYGRRDFLTLDKRTSAVIENPFYWVMNEPNSTLQRLIRKLNMLDSVDEQVSSGKLDMIIQLPYMIRSEQKRAQAEQRRKDIEFQLKGSKYGIAYTDGTEKITQLNRPVENTLLKQIEFLKAELYSHLGLTEEIMNGTADEKTMLNYYNRTIAPFLDAIVESMRVAFLTKTARTQHQSIVYYRDPFKLVPMEQIAEIADKFSRNEILSPNEIRTSIGFKPSKDSKADKLQNSNMPAPSGPVNKNQEGDGQNDSNRSEA